MNWLRLFVIGIFILVLALALSIVLFNLGDLKINSSKNTTVVVDLGKELEAADDFSDVAGVHWMHMPVSYSINESCGNYESLVTRVSFERISAATNYSVSFEEVDDGEIEIDCSFLDGCYNKNGREICSHEMSIVKLTKDQGERIHRAKIELVGFKGFSESGAGSVSGFSVSNCGRFNRETHAILKAFGYSENGDNESIMYAFEGFYGGSCYNQTKEIDEEIVTDLKSKYGN